MAQLVEFAVVASPYGIQLGAQPLGVTLGSLGALALVLDPHPTASEPAVRRGLRLAQKLPSHTSSTTCDQPRHTGRPPLAPDPAETDLRRFESWSQDQARRAGLTPAQHQLLLAVKGHPDERGPTIREAAEYLNTRHHSVVGLVDRAERAGLLWRTRHESDARAVRLLLTELGEERIAQLTQLHLAELARLAPVLQYLLTEPSDASR